MDQFTAFIKKEFWHLLRDYRTVIIIFGIPIAQLLLFGYVITTEIRNAPIAVFDQSKDEVTIAITNKMLASGYFILQSELNSEKTIEPAFRTGHVKMVVVFGNNFGKQLLQTGKAPLQLITDASELNSAGILENYAQSIINNYVKEEFNKPALPISIEHRMYYNEQLRSANMFVPGVITLILMLISALMTSVSIAREKEMGTMEILLVSPLRPIQIILGKVIPYLSLSFLNSFIIIGVGHFVFDVPVKGSLVLLFFLCLLFILLALSIGITISTVAKTQQTAMMISLVGLMLPTILLSGFIFPIENMPLPLRIVSLALPPRWFLSALKEVMLKGVGLAYIWKQVIILLGMLVFFIMLSVKKFKIRLQ